MKHIIAVVVTLLLLLPSFSHAETKEIIAEGTYNMGDGETPTVAESRALLQAKRTAVEEAGTYVESYSKTRNFQLTADEIQVLASGVMEVEVLEKKRTVVGDGFNFWIKIKDRVSTDKMEEMAKRVKEKSVVEDYKKIQEAYDKSQKDIEELKKQLAGARGEKEKKRVEARIADDERLFQANEWLEKGRMYLEYIEDDKAIEAFTSSIALNPNNADAYFNKAIALELDWVIESYHQRGWVYEATGQLDKAIENYNDLISIDPTAFNYVYRGNLYQKSGNKSKAISDFQKACNLAQETRKFVYWEKGCKELQKACDLGNESGCENLQKALGNR